MPATTATDTGFAKMLEHLRIRADGDGHTKGRLFEKVIQSFLKTDTLYKDRFESVWLWDEYPERDKSHDIGADLVAKEREDGSLCAIQCKFYDRRTIQKGDINSFLEAGTRSSFTHMMLVYTGSGYGKNVENALRGHNCQTLNFESLSTSNIDWPDLASGITTIKRRDPYELREDQKKALKNVTNGFTTADRGQLIMACGTGKTLVSLRIAETMADTGGLVLYAVPSISLMHQAIRYWSEQKTIPHGYVGVCSDSKVSHGDEKANIPIVEMELRVTTDPDRIASALSRIDKKKMTVIFSTYQSMKAVLQAQEKTGKKFDLILCDEAHRTTGSDNKNEQGSRLVHNNIRGKKRLYMTATPKIFKPAVKTKAADLDISLYSMDDKAVYGDVLHRLNFSDAIDLKLLSDYRVAVFGIDERYGTAALQKLVDVTTESGDVKLTDAAKMLGLYKALESPDPENKVRPMQTSIVYTNLVADSKIFANTFEKLALEANPKNPFSCDSRHVDGTQNATARFEALEWLRESTYNPNECRILSNARCLSEGVDVPALDSICFMNPKESMVEIVQAVGRVMRRSGNKKYGYVIVPIGIPPNEDAKTILNNNRVYDQVWKILQALRSHDERMDIECNTADLRKKLPERVSIFGVDRRGKVRRHDVGSKTIPVGELDVPSGMIYSKIVDEVGDRRYFEYWAKDVAEVVARLQERIRIVVEKPRGGGSSESRKAFEAYVSGLRDIIHDQLTDQDGIDMLAQHMVTRRIFNAIFDSDDFAKQNPISVVLDNVLDKLRSHGLDTELEKIESFYKSIENRVSKLDTHDARQPVISELYGTFFKKAFPKMSERLGIVYTPQEIVDFILRSVDHVSRENFGLGLTDRSVNVIDPFTGAGTFLVRLMSEELDLIRKEDLKYKYTHELFANEVVLLAYYIALVNCESIYGQRTGKFEQFTGISLTDTFSPGKLDEHTGDIMAKAKEQIRKQRKANITAVIGNPPYSGGQSNFNDQNQNVKYDKIDNRIKETYQKYVKDIGAVGKAGLRDSYIRAIRWASDRIGDSGIIGFVTNASFIRSEAAAGIRTCLQKEFTDIWCFDLRGDVKHKETWKQEGGKIFGSGSKAPVAITILVKNPAKEGKNKVGTIHYKNIGDYYSREKKLATILNFVSITGIHDWQIIVPDKHHDWIGQRNKNFDQHLPIGSKEAKKCKETAVFQNYSVGVGTGRDQWTYNSFKRELSQNIEKHMAYCNKYGPEQPTNTDSKRVKWTPNLTNRLKRFGELQFNKNKIRTALYRPFFKQYLYSDYVLNEAYYPAPKLFPQDDSKNLVIIVPYKFTGTFSTFVTNITPDLEVIHHGQCFPFYIYDDNRHENITKETLQEYRDYYSNSHITKFDIFYYVYGMLHHPGYRSTYANNLTRELPRIPMAPDFDSFAKIGKKLVDLHLSWETCSEYKQIKPKNKPKKFEKLSFGSETTINEDGKRGRITDKSVLLADNVVVFDNLPQVEYMVNGRTPIEWAVDRYKYTIHKNSGIVNDAASDIDVVSLIRRLMFVGMESDRLVSLLPKEFESKNWKPKKDGLDKFSV